MCTIYNINYGRITQQYILLESTMSSEYMLPRFIWANLDPNVDSKAGDDETKHRKPLNMRYAGPETIPIGQQSSQRNKFTLGCMFFELLYYLIGG